MEEPEQGRREVPERRPASGLWIGAAIVLLFAGIAVAKTLAPAAVTAPPEGTSAEPTAAAPSSVVAPSESQADAFEAYAAAVETGKPIYLLFHSLTCAPCVEISAVVDRVIPDYEGRVVFVNAITDDASAQRLAAGFKFQYIPTSFFIKPGGAADDSFTGVLTDAGMRARLDELVAQ